MKTLLYPSILLLIALGTLSCRSSMIEIGGTYGKGSLGNRDNQNSGFGVYAEYRWKKMKDREGSGINYTIQSIQYSPIGGESDGGSLHMLGGRYYRTLSRLDQPLRFDVYAGGGLGFLEYRNGLDLFLHATTGWDLHFFKSRAVYLTNRIGFLGSPGANGPHLSVEVGLGFRIRK